MSMFSNKLYRYEVDVWRHEDQWGELPSRQKRSVQPDILKSLITGSVKPELPKESTHPLEDVKEDEVQLPPEVCPVNEVIRHTIRLNFYSKKLQRCIRALAARKSEYRGPTLAELGKVPEMMVRRKERMYWFGAGQTYPLPPLDKELIHRMLEKAVLAILAQIGYDKVRRSALDTLVDIVKELLNKICQLSHAFAQHDLNRGQVAYDDVLEKSLRTVGLDGIHSVKEYYKRRVLLKRDRAHARARRLLTIYDKLLTEYGLPTAIPEIHFPATGRQNSDALQAILKPGFKMLQTLDQEAQQSIESSSNHQ